MLRQTSLKSAHSRQWEDQDLALAASAQNQPAPLDRWSRSSQQAGATIASTRRLRPLRSCPVPGHQSPAGRHRGLPGLGSDSVRKASQRGRPPDPTGAASSQGDRFTHGDRFYFRRGKTCAPGGPNPEGLSAAEPKPRATFETSGAACPDCQFCLHDLPSVVELSRSIGYQFCSRHSAHLRHNQIMAFEHEMTTHILVPSPMN